MPLVPERGAVWADGWGNGDPGAGTLGRKKRHFCHGGALQFARVASARAFGREAISIIGPILGFLLGVILRPPLRLGGQNGEQYATKRHNLYDPKLSGNKTLWL